MSLPLNTLHPGTPRVFSTRWGWLVLSRDRWSPWNWDLEHTRGLNKLHLESQRTLNSDFIRHRLGEVMRKHPLQRSGSTWISRFYESHPWKLGRGWLSKWVHLLFRQANPSSHPSTHIKTRLDCMCPRPQPQKAGADWTGCLQADQPHSGQWETLSQKYYMEESYKETPNIFLWRRHVHTWAHAPMYVHTWSHFSPPIAV